jgi:hypothetical protein
MTVVVRRTPRLWPDIMDYLDVKRLLKTCIDPSRDIEDDFL